MIFVGHRVLALPEFRMAQRSSGRNRTAGQNAADFFRSCAIKEAFRATEVMNCSYCARQEVVAGFDCGGRDECGECVRSVRRVCADVFEITFKFNKFAGQEGDPVPAGSSMKNENWKMMSGKCNLKSRHGVSR